MSPNTVRDEMTKDLVTVRVDTCLRFAAQLMEERKIRHLPVLRVDGQLIGILSDRDVKRAIDREAPGFRANAQAGEFMSWPLVKVDQSAPLAQSVRLMIEQKISAVVVTEGTRPVGILTSEDLLRVLLELLEKEPAERTHGLVDFSYEPIWREMLRTTGNLGA